MAMVRPPKPLPRTSLTWLGSSRALGSKAMALLGQRPRHCMSLARQARMAALDLVPGQPGIQLLEAKAHPATRANRRGLSRPAPASGGAWLQVVMASDAQNHQVRLRVIAAPEHALLVMNVELARGAVDTTDLAAAAARRDEPPPPR